MENTTTTMNTNININDNSTIKEELLKEEEKCTTKTNYYNWCYCDCFSCCFMLTLI